MELAEQAFVLATSVLAPGGTFVAKVFEGGEAHDFVTRVRPAFTKTKRVKPKATRKESVEFFVVALGRKP